MFHGAFSGEDFETEKKAVFEELRSGLDTPYGYLWRASAYHMYPEETFYSRSAIGTIETVQAATVERVSEYYKGYYIPNNMTFAIVGDIDTDDLLNKLEQRLGKYPSAPVPPSIYEPVSMKAGINLVTEGIITLNQVYNLFDEENIDNEDDSPVFELLEMLKMADRVNIFAGKSSNTASGNIVFKQQGILPRKVILQLLKEKLNEKGKLVVNYEY